MPDDWIGTCSHGRLVHGAVTDHLPLEAALQDLAQLGPDSIETFLA